MVDTRKANANAHPGLVVVAGQQQRRSKQQILADKASAQADSISTREAILARERELLARIASIEDNIQQEDDALKVHVSRPDLRVGSKSPSWKRTTLKRKATEMDYK
jgi:hypothetical protein